MIQTVCSDKCRLKCQQPTLISVQRTAPASVQIKCLFLLLVFICYQWNIQNLSAWWYTVKYSTKHISQQVLFSSTLNNAHENLLTLTYATKIYWISQWKPVPMVRTSVHKTKEVLTANPEPNPDTNIPQSMGRWAGSLANCNPNVPGSINYSARLLWSV